MFERHQLKTVADINQFMFAGNARLTLVSKVTLTRFTYRIKVPKPDDRNFKPIWFVQVLTGPDNTRDYQYIGQLRSQLTSYEHGRRSKISEDAASVKAFKWFTECRLLYPDKMLEQLEVWHEGTCGRCGRALTVPASIANGIGPECARLVGMRPNHVE